MRELGMATVDLTRLPFGASSQTYSVLTTKDGKQQKLCASQRGFPPQATSVSPFTSPPLRRPAPQDARG
jgi:hypothetical protein